MKKLMTKHFSKWALKQNIPDNELSKALAEVQKGKFEANLGGNVFKKESVLREKVKERIVFVHGFAKNEKSNLSKKELIAFKELSKILLSFTDEQLATAIGNGDLIEVTS